MNKITNIFQMIMTKDEDEDVDKCPTVYALWEEGLQKHLKITLTKLKLP